MTCPWRGAARLTSRVFFLSRYVGLRTNYVAVVKKLCRSSPGSRGRRERERERLPREGGKDGGRESLHISKRLYVSLRFSRRAAESQACRHLFQWQEWRRRRRGSRRRSRRGRIKAVKINDDDAVVLHQSGRHRLGCRCQKCCWGPLPS